MSDNHDKLRGRLAELFHEALGLDPAAFCDEDEAQKLASEALLILKDDPSGWVVESPEKPARTADELAAVISHECSFGLAISKFIVGVVRGAGWRPPPRDGIACPCGFFISPGDDDEEVMCVCRRAWWRSGTGWFAKAGADE